MRTALRLAHKLDPPVAASREDAALPFADRTLRSVFHSKAAVSPALATWRACYKLAAHAQGLRLRCAKRLEDHVAGSAVREVAEILLDAYRRLLTEGVAEIVALLAAFVSDPVEAKSDLIRDAFSTHFKATKEGAVRYMANRWGVVPSNSAEDWDPAVYLNTTLRALLEEFGSPAEFEEYLKGVRDLAIAHERDVQNAIGRGALVSRKWTQAFILDRFDSVALRLLHDTAGSIARRIRMMDPDSSPRVIGDLIAAQLTPLEDALARDLERLR